MHETGQLAQGSMAESLPSPIRRYSGVGFCDGREHTGTAHRILGARSSPEEPDGVRKGVQSCGFARGELSRKGAFRAVDRSVRIFMRLLSPPESTKLALLPI